MLLSVVPAGTVILALDLMLESKSQTEKRVKRTKGWHCSPLKPLNIYWEQTLTGDVKSKRNVSTHRNILRVTGTYKKCTSVS